MRSEFEKRLASARGEWKPEDYSKRILVTGDRIAIASDVHIPYHDEKLVAKFLDDCARFEIESIVWLGDLLDMPTFSNWGRTDHTTQYARERAIASTLIEMASEVVATQYWSRGNHEERLFRKTDNQFDMEQLAMSLGLGYLLDSGQLITSDNPSLDAVPNRRGKGTWMLTHPDDYGGKPLVVPGELAMLHQQNILSGHAHHWGMSTDPTGRFTVVETGGLFKPEYHEYKTRRVTRHRKWAPGYWFLIDGRPMGFRGNDN